MRYRLLAIDLDDTLLNPEHSISAFNREMIARVQEIGVKVVLATGRMYQSALPYYQELKLDTYMINYNGALVVNEKGEPLFHAPLSPDLAKEILVAMRKYNSHINLYLHDTLYAEQQGEEMEYYQRLSGIEASLVLDLSSLLIEGPTKIVAISFQQEIFGNMERDLKGIFGDRISLTPSRFGLLEVMAPGISKGASLKRVLEVYRIKPEEVMAFGDGQNDMTMIASAGLGVAMENGHDRLKQVAQRIAPPNHEDGVGKMVKEYFFKEGGEDLWRK